MSDHMPRQDAALPPTISEAKLMDRIEELENSLTYWKADSAAAWDKCEEHRVKLANAVEIALEECPFAWGTGSYNDWWSDRRTTLAELKGEDRG